MSSYNMVPQCGQIMGGVLVAGGGPRTPSEHCYGTLEQGAKPPNRALDLAGNSSCLHPHAALHIQPPP